MKRAFTLVEILVVIAVIAMLMGILMPVLRYVRLRGMSIICGSNLRQVSFALEMYEQKNNAFPSGFNDELFFSGKIPPGSFPGNASRDYMGWWWFHFILPYIDDDLSEEGVFWCPARTVQDTSYKPNLLCGNYGVNQSVCKSVFLMKSDFNGKPLNLASIKKSSRTILVMDSGYALINWKAASSSGGKVFENPHRLGSVYVPGMEINKDRSIDPCAEIDALDGRHPNKTVNIIFTDGHLSSVKSDDLFLDSDDSVPAAIWSESH